jgi:hypothetical protein
MTTKQACTRCAELEQRVAELEARLAFGAKSSYEKALVFAADKEAGLSGAMIAVKYGLAKKSAGYVNSCVAALSSDSKVVSAWKSGRVPDKKMFELNVHQKKPALQRRLLQAFLTHEGR